jgi:hypothetical protein
MPADFRKLDAVGECRGRSVGDALGRFPVKFRIRFVEQHAKVESRLLRIEEPSAVKSRFDQGFSASNHWFQ